VNEPTRYETNEELGREVKRHVDEHRAKCPESESGFARPCPCGITKVLICSHCKEIICTTALVPCEHFERAATSKTLEDLYRPHLRVVK
jgi:hypothetical protein